MALPPDMSPSNSLLYSGNLENYLKASGSPVPYIAVEFDALDFGSYEEFIVGDGKIYPALTGTPKNSAADKKYLNIPLSPDTTYTAFQKFYSNKVCTTITD